MCWFYCHVQFLFDPLTPQPFLDDFTGATQKMLLLLLVCWPLGRRRRLITIPSCLLKRCACSRKRGRTFAYCQRCRCIRTPTSRIGMHVDDSFFLATRRNFVFYSTSLPSIFAHRHEIESSVQMATEGKETGGSSADVRYVCAVLRSEEGAFNEPAIYYLRELKRRP